VPRCHVQELQAEFWRTRRRLRYAAMLKYGECGMKKPFVNVMVITYNHKPYIAEALQSILDQNVDFPVVINVIDDCSNDGTHEILHHFKSLYPDRINLFINEKNIGNKVTQRNFYKGFLTLKGDYIAILEGDDYWSSPDKLGMQIEFLENNPGCVAAAHNVLKIYEGQEREPHLFLPSPDKRLHQIDDIINISSYFHISTLVFRHVLKDRVPPQFRNKWSCELFVTMAHAQYGDIWYIPDTMSVYRSHPGGMFSNMSQTSGWMFNIDGMRRYNRWLGFRYATVFTGAIYRYCEYLLRHGQEADGLSRQMRIKYRSLMIFYRAAFDYLRDRRLDVLRPSRLMRP
jgi:glycosyltransferase involved in cell wall biosynthesis